MAMIEMTASGEIIKANDIFLHAMGYELNEIVGQHHKIFCMPEYYNSNDYGFFWKRLAGGERFSDGFKRLNKSGKDVWLEASYIPIKDESGMVYKVVKIATDISSSVTQSNSNRSLIEALNRSMAVIEFDLQGKIVTANENFLIATGYSLEEIRGRHHKIFCSDEIIESQEYDDFWKSLRSGIYASGLYRRVDKKGRAIWLNATYNPLFDISGKLYGVIKVASDETGEVVRRIKETEAAKLAYDTSKKTDESTLQGISAINEATIIAEALASDMKDASAHFAKLNEESRKIRSIVSCIKDIASQTNLLSLNAAIEAATAGNQGRSFAIVADEVRKLSFKTSKAASDITTVVDTNSVLTQEAVNKMMQGLIRAEEGAMLTERAGKVVRDIHDDARTVVSAMNTFSSLYAEEA